MTFNLLEDCPPFLKEPLFIPPPEPTLIIQRQPKKRGYRFRYSSEGQTHGGIPGEPDNSSDKTKHYPTLQVLNYSGPAKVVVTLVTANSSQLHPHSLIVNKVMTKGYHIYDKSHEDSVLELKSIAIQHVVKDKLEDTLMHRILSTKYVEQFGWNSGLNNGVNSNMFDVSTYVKALRDAGDSENVYLDRTTARTIAGYELDNLRRKAKQVAKEIEMNQVRLCFQAFLPGETGKYTKILPAVYSDIIYDGKTKQGSTLKIIRISKVSCTVQGNEEVWVIADKINADDLEVRFFEEESFRKPAWEDFGVFNKTEIYKQCVLIFKTPAYHDQSIRQPANVLIQLRRKNDKGCHSIPMDFKYTPIHHDRYGIGDKRKKNVTGIDFDQPSSSKRRYDEDMTPISDLPQSELLVNASNFDSITAFNLSDPSLFLPYLKQEDTTDETNALNQNAMNLWPQINGNFDGAANNVPSGSSQSLMNFLSLLSADASFGNAPDNANTTDETS